MACWLGEIPVCLPTIAANFEIPTNTAWVPLTRDTRGVGGTPTLSVGVTGGIKDTSGGHISLVWENDDAVDTPPPPQRDITDAGKMALVAHIPHPFDAPVTYVEYVEHDDVLETMLAYVERGAATRGDDTALRRVLERDIAKMPPGFIGFSFFVTGMVLIADLIRTPGAQSVPLEARKVIREQVGRLWRLLFGELGDTQLGLESLPSRDMASASIVEFLDAGIVPWVQVRDSYLGLVAWLPGLSSPTCFLGPLPPNTGVLWGPLSMRSVLTEYYIGELMILKMSERMPPLRHSERTERRHTIETREWFLHAVSKLNYARSMRLHTSNIRVPPHTTLKQIIGAAPPCIARILREFKDHGKRLKRDSRQLVWPTMLGVVRAAGISPDAFYAHFETPSHMQRTRIEFTDYAHKHADKYIVSCGHASACAACPFPGDIEDRTRTCSDTMGLSYPRRAPIARLLAKLEC